MADISSGPIIVMCLSKKNAIEDWINLICPPNVPEARPLFPASLEAKYGEPKEDTFNGLHGSKDEEIAEKEIRFFFPESKLDKTTGYIRQSYYQTTGHMAQCQFPVPVFLACLKHNRSIDR